MTHFRTILFWIWDIWCNSKILESHQDAIYQTSGEIDKWQWMFHMSYQLKRIRDNSQPFCSNKDHKLVKLLDSLFLKCKQKWPKLQVKKCLTVIIVVSSTCSSFRIQRAIHYRGTSLRQFDRFSALYSVIIEDFVTMSVRKDVTFIVKLFRSYDEQNKHGDSVNSWAVQIYSQIFIESHYWFNVYFFRFFCLIK